eukprot:GGOE01036785.1.p1 GENE.GGOE01036785.1~~GGOE01036785.1.p1  ORF type:complete len:291 (-),score=76.44 GGOE01036785.1:364-1164(-)
MEELGRRCLAQQNYQQALRFFEQKAVIDPNNEELEYLIHLTRYKLSPATTNPARLHHLVAQQVLQEANLYRLLGVPPSASAADITRAYKALALLLHPDKNSDPLATAAFAQAQRAYDVLGSVEARQTYDEEQQQSLEREMVICQPSVLSPTRRTPPAPSRVIQPLRSFEYPEVPLQKVKTVKALRDHVPGTSARPPSPPKEVQPKRCRPPRLAHLNREYEDCRLRLGDLKLDNDYRAALWQLRSFKERISFGPDPESRAESVAGPS